LIQPQEHQYYQQWFYSVDADRSGTVTGQELGLIQFNGQPIGPNVGFKLVKVFDKDGSGAVDLREYSILHKFLTLMQNAFLTADSARQGVLTPTAAAQALTSSGFPVSQPTIQGLIKKFNPTGQNLDFPTFLFMVAHLAQARTVFEKFDRARTGTVSLNYDGLVAVATEVL